MDKNDPRVAPAIERPRSESWRGSSLALGVLAGLAGLYTLYFAADFLIPVTAAIVLHLVLTPVPRFLARFRVPEVVSASLIVPSFFLLVFIAVYGLAEPARDWMDRIPEVAREIQIKLRDIKEPVAEVQQASQELEKVATVDDGGAKQPEVQIKSPDLLEGLFGTLQEVGIQTGATFVLLYFLLASGQMFKEKLVRVLPRLQDKKRAVLVTKEIERDVSSYLFTMTMINAGLGLAIGFGLFAIGLPNALMWGVIAALLNFVPYLGALCGIAVVLVAGLVTFDSLSQALLAPAIYAGFNLLEAQIVTPSVLGRRLTLNSVIVFLSVGFWGWIWGVPGALLAVPLLVILKVLCNHIERLSALGEFLSDRSAPES